MTSVFPIAFAVGLALFFLAALLGAMATMNDLCREFEKEAKS